MKSSTLIVLILSSFLIGTFVWKLSEQQGERLFKQQLQTWIDGNAGEPTKFLKTLKVEDKVLLPRLLKKMERASWSQKLRLVSLFAALESKSLSFLASKRKHRDWRVREMIARSIILMKGSEQRRIRLLEGFFADRNAAVRYTAVRGLAGFGRKAQSILPAFQKELKDAKGSTERGKHSCAPGPVFAAPSQENHLEIHHVHAHESLHQHKKGKHFFFDEKDRSWGVRYVILDSLHMIESDPIEQARFLMGALLDRDQKIRTIAHQRLVRLKPKSIRFLVGALKRSEPNLRFAIADVLAAKGSKSLRSLLRSFVEKKMDNSWYAVAHALEKIPTQLWKQKEIDLLCPFLDDPEKPRRASTEIMLSRLGGKAIPCLKQAWRESRWFGKSAVLRVLGLSKGLHKDKSKWKKQILPFLKEGLRASKFELRKLAVWASGFWLGQNDELFKELLGMKHERKDFPAVWLEALTRIAPSNSMILTLLESGLVSKDPLFRIAALRALHLQSSLQTSTLSLLGRTLGDPNAKVRSACFKAFCAHSKQKELLPILNKVLKAKQLLAWVSASQASGCFGEKAGSLYTLMLRRLRENPHNFKLGEAILRGFGRIGTTDHRVIEVLKQSTSDSDWRIRAVACHSLASFVDDKFGVRELLVALVDKKWLVRKQAAYTLGKMKRQAREALPLLGKMRQSDLSISARVVADKAIKAILKSFRKPPR